MPPSREKFAESRTGKGNGESHTPPAKASKIQLNDIHAIRRELAKLYREARGGQVPAADATKLGHLLELLRRMVETGDLQDQIAEQQRQIEELEEKLKFAT